jgi:hypothetical protein
MERRYVRGFNAVAQEELWNLWPRGESLKAIGRAFGKPSSSIYFQVAPHGGIRPRRRRRSRLVRMFVEREEISRGIEAARSLRAMARLLGHAPSMVRREIRRNAGYDRYRAAVADANAWRRACRPKRCKLASSPRLRGAVARMLGLNWSPVQIAGWLERAYPEDGHNQVSHETVYCSLYVQACRVLVRHLRSKRTMRRPRRIGDKRGQLWIWCRSASNRRRLRIGQFRVIGKAIYCPGRITARSQPSSNGRRVI